MSFTPGQALRAASLLVILLVSLSLGCHAIRLGTGHDHILGLLPLLDLNSESNLPSWFSASMLLVNALLLLLIGAQQRAAGDRFARHWLVLGCFFILMSLDESIGLHEMITRPLRRLIHPPGLFYYAWILPAIALVAGFGLAYLKFVRALPDATRRWLVAAGLTYVGGAVVMEALAGRYDRFHGHDDGVYMLLATIEESGELLGSGLFLYALLGFIAHRFPATAAVIGLRGRSEAAPNPALADAGRSPAPPAERSPAMPNPADPAGEGPVWSLRLGLALLAAYSVCLLALEWSTSQQDIRLFFTDIGGDTPLYGLNTTLCVGLLWGAGLLFCVAGLSCPRGAACERAFIFSQAVVFVYLACDERFQLHERIGRQLGIEDALVLIGIGLIEATLLWRPGGLLRRGARQMALMAAAGALFAGMALVDAALPSSLSLRLSAEDLLKTWACVFVFLFAWENCRAGIRSIALRA